MRVFEQIDQYHCKLQKAQWFDGEMFSAHCIGLVQDGDHAFICDIRKVWPEALHEFIRLSFPHLFVQSGATYRQAIFGTIKAMYTPWMKHLKDTYKPLIDYTNVDKEFLKHQYASTWRMIMHQHNFLSYEMGLGKTITSVNLSKILDIQRTVIVAPAGVKWSIFHDLVDSWGYDHINITMLDARKEKCRRALIEKFVIINYENIIKHFEYLKEGHRGPVGHIIVDEVHNCKNHLTNKFKAVKKLIDYYPKARVTLLTGTPITNRINDLFAYFKMANHPLGNNQLEFSRRYIEKSKGDRGKIVGAKNLDELRLRYSNFMIRKRTEECIDLPDMIIKKCYLDESEITEEYKDVLRAMYENRMAQEADGKSVGELETQFSTNVHTLNRILATAKIKSVIADIDELWEQGEKVIVFSTYRATLEAIKSHYKEKCVIVHGGVNTHERSIRAEKFRKDPNCHVFVGNDKAAGEGINLVNARYVLRLNFPFTPDRIEQPQKRSHRMGQTLTVFSRYYIVKGSIDEHIYSIIVDKSTDINELLDKNKPGVINYQQIDVMKSVYNKLINQYAEEHNLAAPESSKFVEA